VIAAQAWGLDAQSLSHALLQALWAEEQDIAAPETRIAIADKLGMDGKALQAAETSDVAIGQYQANTREALELGVFGAPSYVWRGVIFWGQDRLAFLDRAMAEAGV
jgi:2-hydroxychromene-2-carboxylate isomerase